MARTPLTIVESSKAGTALPAGTAADVANGNSVASDGKSVIVIATNANVSTPRNVTITPTATVDGLAAATRTVALPANTAKVLGPYELANYSDTLQISGDNADVKFQVIRVPGI
ncbi:hypothetical protein AMIS_20780 [Actinoplanes missouriensis 431]|uniref:Uncharacterized protein n=1 Tax=Actinoplanes missouriensis (strain ATCC 14538 / DSM 43046 / CBS 188.64 / JCM 3121 / NBRC 102363 / NCIMB 12654 / NRRL B-3342 / UNCC 431) TaxID=512565 RepID=I0H2R1_ACTM4|nr:hypothetical protein [Actinoplanes missouriensis]BAL87298.1 hypothetical protein AMIS_20780 [Actinoplanes missouriensis 431]